MRVEAWVAVVVLVLCGGLAAAAGTGVAGDWLGKIAVQGTELRVACHLTKLPDGTYAATVDSLDQGVRGIPVQTATVKEGVLRLELPAIGATFEGKVNAAATVIEGQWRQSGTTLPLRLERVAQMEKPKRPQLPVKPYPYREEEVTFPNASAGVTLAGTLTLPSSGGPFPAVVLISGSGPQDRDETLYDHKPFLVLADALTRRGIAVLRYDDRGVGKSTGDRTNATTEDYASDAGAAVAYLRSRPEIDAKRIGLIGHSEGAMAAPMVAAKSSEIAFLVLIAGPGLPGEQILLEQQALIGKAAGAKEEMIARQTQDAAALYTVVKEEKDNTVAATRLREAVLASFSPYSEEQRKTMGLTDEVIQAQVQLVQRELLSPWFRFFVTYDPRPTLAKVTVPVLAIWGEKDLQVAPAQNRPEVEKALHAAGNTHATLRVLPGLNHLLQTAKTGSPTEYAEIEETMAPAALQAIGDWVVQVTQTKR